LSSDDVVQRKEKKQNKRDDTRSGVCVHEALFRVIAA